MFEYFVRPHVCLSVSVEVAFYFKLVLGGREVGLSLNLGFLGECVFLNGVLFGGGGGGWFYFDFLGDYILQRGILLFNFFLCFVVNLY